MAKSTTGYTLFFDSLEELFEKADYCIKLTVHDTVRIEGTVRMTGGTFTAEGDELEDAIEQAIDKVNDVTWILEDICLDYGISFDKLRELVGSSDLDQAMRVTENDFDLIDWYESRAWADGYEAGRADASSEPTDDATLIDQELIADAEYQNWLRANGIEAMPVQLAAAQPFVMLDGGDNVYLALKLAKLDD